MFETAWQDVRYGLRLLRRSPLFTATAALSLAIGIGANTTIFSVASALLLRPLPGLAGADRLVDVGRTTDGRGFDTSTFPNFTDLRERVTTLSELYAYRVEPQPISLSDGRDAERIYGIPASGNFFRGLGVVPAAGRLFTDNDDRPNGPPVAVISYDLWQRRFGGASDTIGRSVTFNSHPVTIVGVAPAGFQGTTIMRSDAWVPLTLANLVSPRFGREMYTNRRITWLVMGGRLKDGVTVAQADAELRSLGETLQREYPTENRGRGYRVMKSALVPGQTNNVAGFLGVLLAIVALVLLAACVNLAGMLLARATSRRREIAVRLAIGAGRARLVRQMLTESMVLTAIAAAAGLLFAKWGAGSLLALLTTRDQVITLDAGISNRILVFSLALAAITSAVCSVFPAIRATRADPASGLKSETGTLRTLGSGPMSGRTIVAAQVAVSVLLLASATLFVRSLYGVLSTSAGVDRQVLVLTADAEAAGYEGDRAVSYYQQLLERVRNVPGVEAASLSMYPPLSGGDGAWNQNVGIDGAAPGADAASLVYFNTVSSGYFRTTGMTLLRGRDIEATDNASAVPVAVVNEGLAKRFFPGQDPIGRQLTMGRGENRRSLQIVGVVSDAKYQRLQEEPRAVAYLPWMQQRVENLFLELRAGSPAAVSEAAHREARSIDPVVPVQLQTVGDRIRESLVTERVLASLATVLAFAAALLACAGLYGLLSYAVARQTREIGLRLALGAHPRSVTRKVLTDSLVLTGIGVVLGLAGALVLGRFASRLVVKLAPTDPISIAAAAVLMLAVAGLASAVPAWRAARIDPVVALKVE